MSFGRQDILTSITLSTKIRVVPQNKLNCSYLLIALTAESSLTSSPYSLFDKLQTHSQLPSTEESLGNPSADHITNNDKHASKCKCSCMQLCLPDKLDKSDTSDSSDESDKYIRKKCHIHTYLNYL